MTVVVVLAVVALLLVILAMLPVGCQVEYGASGLAVWARVGPLRIPVFPWKKKEKSPEKAKKKPVKDGSGEKKPAAAPAQQPSLGKRVGGALEYFQALLPVAIEAAGRFYHKLRVDHLELELTVGTADPADAALAYGKANVVLASLWEPLTSAFHVKDGTARIQVDFNGGGTKVYGAATLSIRVGQGVYLGVVYGLKALKTFLRVREEQASAKQQRKAA